MASAMTLSQTPRGFAVTLAGACHLGILAAIAGYVACYYPGARPATLALLLAAVVSETCPPAWKRWLFGEILLVVSGIASYLLLVDWGDDSFQGWLRMLLAYWLLVPSRPGLLRWGLSLIIAELLIIGAEPSRYGDLYLGRLPLLGRFSLPTPLLLLLPIGIVSLALDAWLRVVLQARGIGGNRDRSGAAMRWAIVPGIVIATLLIVIGPLALPLAKRPTPRLTSEGGVSGLKRPSIRPGESQWVIKDPTPKARLLWDDADQPQIRGTAYLRLFTLPYINLENDNLIAWSAEDNSSLRRVSPGFDPGRSFAWIVRRPLGNDAVLASDGALGIELADLLGDSQGNRYQESIDGAPRAYRVNLDPPEDRDPEVRPEWLEVPPALDLLPWNRIEDPAWRTMPAGEAGDAIRTALAARCRYDIENLPTPAPGAGGVMRTFLFGKDEERRGHCQYFSTAAAILLRRLGHPTRCVAGFASNEQDADGYLFRGLHAHAWLEVRDAQGAWQRIDATPEQALRMDGVDLTATGDGPPIETTNTIADIKAAVPDEAAPAPMPWWILLPVPVLVLLLILRRTARGPRTDPRQAELDRHSGNLVKFASQLGVPVAPHTTLSEIAARVSERTGIDLAPYLQAHLAARFGNGPLPPPWPIAELRAARQRPQPALR